MKPSTWLLAPTLITTSLLLACQSSPEETLTTPEHSVAETATEPHASEPGATASSKAPSYEREHFVTKVEELGGDSHLLWVFREDTPEAREAAAGREPAKNVSMIGAGPGGISLRAPDKETIVAYLRSDVFYTKIEELGGDSRVLWVFRKGTPEADAAMAGSEPAKNVSWIGAGPDGITLRAPDKETLHSYCAADEFTTTIEDLGDGWEVLWVFRRGSAEAQAALAGSAPGQHVTLVSAGPDGENVCAPDRATAIEYLAQRRGFYTKVEELGGDSLILWIFQEGTPEAAAARGGMEPAKNVSRIGAGPDGISLRAPDVETLDAYRARM